MNNLEGIQIWEKLLKQPTSNDNSKDFDIEEVIKETFNENSL